MTVEIVDNHKEAFIQQLKNDISIFNEQYINQFLLDIPKGVINKIDYYRDTFFPYLVHSDYKSNDMLFITKY